MGELVIKNPDITANATTRLVAQKFYDLEIEAGATDKQAFDSAWIFREELSKNEGFHDFVAEDFTGVEYGTCLKCKKGFVPDAGIFVDKFCGYGLNIRYSGEFYCPECLKTKSKVVRHHDFDTSACDFGHIERGQDGKRERYGIRWRGEIHAEKQKELSWQTN